jgi:hypothetical protein
MTTKWETGYYQPSENFLQIREHRAIMRSDNQKLIAVCGPTDYKTERVAQLIAAAPDLLEALKVSLSLVDLIAGYAEEMPSEVLTTALTTGQQIEQAIARAEGEP